MQNRCRPSSPTIVRKDPCTWDDERPIGWERDRTVLGPIPLKTQVAYVDSALDRVTLLDLEPDVPVLSTRDIGRRAMVATPCSP